MQYFELTGSTTMFPIRTLEKSTSSLDAIMLFISQYFVRLMGCSILEMYQDWYYMYWYYVQPTLPVMGWIVPK